MKTQIKTISIRGSRLYFWLFYFFLLTYAILGANLFGQAPNRIEQITSAQGLGNDGCTAVLLSSAGELWATHQGFTPAVPYNSNRPISRRDTQGNWTYPDLSLAPVVVGTSTTYNSNADYQFDKIVEQSNGHIWFLPGPYTGTNTDMGFAAPIIMYDGVNWNSFHSVLGNFPNAGSVLDLVEDNAGNLWFGCAAGLVRMDPLGATTFWNPPAVPHINGLVKQADNIVSVDINNAGHVVMVASEQNTANGGAFLGWSCVREFDAAANSWQNWHLYDAPWANALQIFYQPKKIVAMNDNRDRLYVSTAGRGLYYIDNGNFASNQNTMISHHQGWSHPGWSFEHVYTNLPNWTSEVFKSEQGEFWTIAHGSGQAQNAAYKFHSRRPTTYNGEPAGVYAFARKQSDFNRIQGGVTYRADILNMDFGPNDQEVWFATEHGLERWYADYPNPAADFIGIKGAGANDEGVVAFNTHMNGLAEPIGKGHVMPVGTPTISIDTAYYYLATSDYDQMDTNVASGLEGDGTVQGFNATAGALAALGLGFDALQLEFTPIDLGNDIRGEDDDWTYDSGLETRRYQKRMEQIDNSTWEARSHYTILLNGFTLFEGEMPLVDLHIRYNKYGYLFDSIAAISDFVQLDTTEWLDDLCDCLPNAGARSVAEALLQDIGNYGIRFQFRSIQSANQEDLNSPGRTGGFFVIHKAMIEKGSVPLPPEGPMGGIVLVGPSAQADYAELQDAVNDLQRRGVDNWVQFRIEPGIYEGIFEFGNIPGMAGFNNRNIMLVSHTGDSSDVVVRKKPGRSDTNYVFRINGSQDVRFVRLTIENEENADTCRLIQVDSPMEVLSIQNSVLKGGIHSTDVEEANLVHLNSNCENFFSNFSRYRGGRQALFLRSFGEIRLGDNHFLEQQGYAIHLERMEEGDIYNNLFHGPSSGRFNGIYVRDTDDGLRLNRNRFINQRVACGSAIYLHWGANPNNWNDGGIQILNNEISVFGDAQSRAVNLSGNYTLFYHNSILMNGTDTNAVALYCDFIWDDARVKNSIVQTESGLAVNYQKWLNFGADLDENIYFSQNPRPFLADIGLGPQRFEDLSGMRSVAGTDSSSVMIDPEFLAVDFLLPMNAAAHDLAAAKVEANTDFFANARDAQWADHGCYEFDSTYISLNCSFPLQAVVTGNYQVQLSWEDLGAARYNVYFKPVGDLNWLALRANSNSRTIRNRQPGEYEAFVHVPGSPDSSCTVNFTIDCEDFGYSTNVFQINDATGGKVNVFGVNGGRRLWDFGLSNGQDTTWVNNRWSNRFIQLEAGTYFTYVRDGFGCYSLQVDTIVINTVDSAVIPELLSIQNLGNGTLRPVWSIEDNSQVDRYMVRVRDVSGGGTGVLQGTYIAPGGGSTQLDIAALPAGRYRVDVRARINGSFVGSVYSNYKERIIASNKISLSSNAQEGRENMHAFPNPTSDRITILAPKGSEIQLLDGTGRLLLQKPMTREEIVLNLAHRAAGVYLLRISTGREIHTERIVKE